MYNRLRREVKTIITIFDAAEYILSKMGSVTTMKLQKLLYYSQAWSLAWDEIPLFESDFQAWANGPVCPELFNAHRGEFSVSSGCFSSRCVGILTSRHTDIIDAVADYYGDKPPQWLSDLTHLERPWKETSSGLSIGDWSDRVIIKELMQEYYSSL